MMRALLFLVLFFSCTQLNAQFNNNYGRYQDLPSGNYIGYGKLSSTQFSATLRFWIPCVYDYATSPDSGFGVQAFGQYCLLMLRNSDSAMRISQFANPLNYVFGPPPYQNAKGHWFYRLDKQICNTCTHGGIQTQLSKLSEEGNKTLIGAGNSFSSIFLSVDTATDAFTIFTGVQDVLNDSLVLYYKNIHLPPLAPPITPGLPTFETHSILYSRIYHWHEYASITAPDITNLLPIVGVKGKTVTYSMGVKDAEGDSVVFTPLLTPITVRNFHPNFMCPAIPNPQTLTTAEQNYVKHALIDSTQSLPYYPGYSYTQPFGPGNWSLNAVTGQFSFTPPDSGFYYLAFRMSEYRNGQLLGDNMYVRTAYVIDSSGVVLPALHGPYAFTGATYDTTTASTSICPGQSISFTVNGTIPVAGAQLWFTDNHAAVLPGSTATYFGGGTDSATSTVSWTPTGLDSGWHYFTWDVADTACGPTHHRVHESKTFRIYVTPGIALLASKDTVCRGSSTTLSIAGTGPYTWSIVPGGDPSIPCNTCQSNTVSPTVNTAYIVTKAGLNCVTKDTLLVRVIQDFSLTPARDTSFCVNIPASYIISANPQPGPATGYTYAWTGSGPLGNANTRNATVQNPALNGSYIVTVKDTFGCFTHYDTIRVRSYNGPHSLSPKLDTLCPGEQTQLTVTGGTRWAWTPATGLSCANCPSPIASPLITTFYLVSITDTASGCNYYDSALIVTYPAPNANAGSDITASGGPFRLDGTGNGTYSWSPGIYLEDSTNAVTRGRVATSTVFVLTVKSGPCVGKDTVTVFYTPCVTINMPNAFAPNGSGGRTNRFIWTNTEPIECLGFVVFNRWGQKVWEQNGGITEGWDGMLNGKPAQQGVYVYMLKVRCPNNSGEIFVGHGNVTLVR